MGSSPSLCTMVSNSATTVHHSCQLVSMHSARDSVCNHSCDWCRRDGAAHRVQSASDGRRARRLAGSGSEPSAASLLHTAPQLRTAGRDEQTSCKSRRADTRPAACEQRLLQLRCRWASASSVGQLASAAQPAVGAASTAADPIDFKLNCFPSSLSELCPKRKKQRKRPLRAELPPVVIKKATFRPPHIPVLRERRRWQ